MGFDRIRSRIEVETIVGQTFVRWANENYRGSPSSPLTDKEVEASFAVAQPGFLTTIQSSAYSSKFGRWKSNLK